MTEHVVSGELHLDRISDKRTRDVLRQAAAMARHGDPVWIVNRAGERIGRIVAPDARLLRPADEAEDDW